MRKQNKKAVNLIAISKNGKPQVGDVLISSFLPFTDRQGPKQRHFSLSQAEGQGSLRQAFMCGCSNKTNENKSKKQFQRGVRIGSSPQHYFGEEHHAVKYFTKISSGVGTVF